MTRVEFSTACTGCGACLLTCPTHAIRPDGGRLRAVDRLCTGCGECVEVCPADAITVPLSSPILRFPGGNDRNVT